MPSLSDINKNSAKKFKKKNYRAYNFDGESDLSDIQQQTDSKPIANQQLTDSKPIANQQQTDSKPIANQQQTDSKPIANQQLTASKPIANQQQTDSKPIANQQQTDSKPIANQQQTDSKPIANQQQTDSKPIANQQLTDSKPIANQQQTDSKPIANQQLTDSKPIANQQQTDSKLLDFTLLSPLKMKLVVYIYNSQSLTKENITEPLKVQIIANEISTSIGGAKDCINKLCSGSILKRIQYKAGKFGWTIYSLDSSIFNQIKALIKANALRELLNPTFPIYSSNNKLTTITTKEKEENKTPEPVIVDKHEKAEDTQNDSWSNINTSALDEHGISKGFVHNIKKLNTVSAEIAQESINHFGYRLDQGDIPAKWKNPLSVLFGTLKKGGAWVEGGYRSPQEIAEEKRIEMKREELNRKKLRHLEELEIAFEEWSMELSYDEKKAMIGDDTYNATLKLTGAAEAQQWLESELRSKFEMEIYKK